MSDQNQTTEIAKHGPWTVTLTDQATGEVTTAIVDSIQIEYHNQEIWSDGTLTGKPGFVGRLYAGSTITMQVAEKRS